ncbi:MAG: TerB family tellurite resistance protein [Gammaproteobacteria bacterium]|nr:TerB family tellurite resistance protein [Gammaproteobacteria bacterium]
MLNHIKKFFDEHLSPSVTENSSTEKLQIACAALFLEMMLIDGIIEDNEQTTTLELVQNTFSLTASQASELIKLAEQSRQQATDDYRFIALINKEYNQKQKLQLIESLWKIAFIDGNLDTQEEYLVRKIANLLYIPHSDFIMAKHRVYEEQ